MKRISRREFLDISSKAAIGSILYPKLVLSQVFDEVPDFIESAPFPLEEYPFRGWEELYREQYKFDGSFPAHLKSLPHGQLRCLAHIRKGVIVRLEPWFVSNDLPTSLNQGVSEAAYSQLRQVYSQARIKKPMIRRGFQEGNKERGNGEWEAISWKEAYEIVSRKIIEVMKRDGPEGIKVVTSSLSFGPITKQGSLIRFANMIGARAWIDGPPIDRALDGISSYYFEDPENLGKIRKRVIFENPLDFIMGKDAKRTKIRWHARHDFLTRCGSIYEIIKKRDPEVELIVVQASEFNLTCEYADIVLPVHTWAETTMPDLVVIGPNLAIDISKGGIKPLYDSLMDVEIVAQVARKMAELSKNSIYSNYWDQTPEDFIQKVLDSGSMTQGFKISDFDDGPGVFKIRGNETPLTEGTKFPEKDTTADPSSGTDSLYLRVIEGRHSFGPEWGLSDLNQVLSCNFGDPWDSDKRAPNLAEAELEMNPKDAQGRGIDNGDYIWVDSVMDIEADFRTMIRCKFNPGIPQGSVLIREGWHPATPQTKKAQQSAQGKAVTKNGYRAHYRSGGVQNIVRIKSELTYENEIGYASLATKEALVQITKAEDGNYKPAKSDFSVTSKKEVMERYLRGELSRRT